MHSTNIAALAAVLLAGNALAVANVEPFKNLQPRQTNAADAACTSSYLGLLSRLPTPTDSGLINWLATQTEVQPSVPTSLTAALCTYERSLVSWASSVAAPFVTQCSSLIDEDDVSSARAALSSGISLDSFCSASPTNAAPRETGFMNAGVLAAAGVAAAAIL